MPSPKEVAAWIFQAVPGDYNLRQALADLDEDVWVARQRRKDMAPGQRVYIWLARPGGGVVAVGQIASIVESAPAPGWQLPYRQPSVRVAASQPEPRVRVRYSAKFLHAPLSRSFLASDPILARQPPIGPVYVGTNFAVGSDAEERLQAIMRGRP
jgi:EVE domain